ncbi:MAG: hypothetical protein JJT75_00330 [Opitutales bacterium]|nr:hypothetical protein [Opitutales bacterium]MCH8541307.1 hypothetical protein [Opitutales bacterium]
MLFSKVTDSDTLSWVQNLPKTETHLHLEGALPYEELHRWKPAEFPRNPDFLEGE